MTSPADGPLGDSAVIFDDGTTRLLNQNDARPGDLDALHALGPFDAPEADLAEPAEEPDISLRPAPVLLDPVGQRHDPAPQGGVIPRSQAEIFCGNSGTTIRFLTALCSLGTGQFTLDGIARMRQRPIGALTGMLKNLGVRAQHSPEADGFPPHKLIPPSPLYGCGPVTLNVSSPSLPFNVNALIPGVRTLM